MRLLMIPARVALSRSAVPLVVAGDAQLELYREGDAWWAARAGD